MPQAQHKILLFKLDGERTARPLGYTDFYNGSISVSAIDLKFPHEP